MRGSLNVVSIELILKIVKRVNSQNLICVDKLGVDAKSNFFCGGCGLSWAC